MQCADRSERRPARVPVRRLLVHAGDAEQPGFAEGGAEELKAEGEGLVARGEAAGEADAGDGGDVARDGEDVAEVHLQRVAGLLAGLEGRGGARGAGDDV